MNLKPKTLSWLICAVLIAVTVLIYWPVLRSEFVIYDDDTYVTDNPHVNTGLTWNNVAWAFTSKEVSNWHPLTWLSHMLDVQIYGLHPWGHHLTNLLFHIANSLLLFYWLRQFTGALWRSALVAALFAWHPLHVESVAWVAERKDVLSTFFWLLALICYRKFQVRERDFPLFYATAIVCFVLGLMAKPMVVTLPFVLLLLDYWEYNRRGNARPPWWKLVKEKIPFFALAAISCYVTYVVQQEGGAMHAASKMVLSQRFSNSVFAYFKYLELTFWPHNLGALYPISNLASSKITVCEILLLAVSAYVKWQFKAIPYLTVGWCWFLGTLVPVIGLIQVGAQSMADRYTYIPSIGIFIMLAWGLNDFLKHRRLMTIGVSVALFFLGYCAVAASIQVRYWKNSETLFRHALDVTADNVIIYSNLGSYYVLQDNPKEAISYYEKGVAIQSFAALEMNLSDALAQVDRNDDAFQHLDKALKLEPENTKAHLHLGQLYYKLGKTNEAIAQTEEALKYDANYLAALKFLGKMLQDRKDLLGASLEVEKAAKLEPENAETQSQLGGILTQAHRDEEAVVHYRIMEQIYESKLKADPKSVAVLNNYAWLLASCPNSNIRDGKKAVELAQHACELSEWKFPLLMGTLSASLAEAGRFEEATKMAERASQLAASQGHYDIARKNSELMKIYQSGKAYRGL